MGFDLSSSFLKVDRALEHFKTLQTIDQRVRDEAKGKEALAEKHFNRKQKCWVFTAQGLVPFPVTIGPVIGDHLHNLRSALDHIAWQLVLNGRVPHPKKPGDVGFPLYTVGRSKTQGRGFWANRKRRLPGVVGERLAIVERYQPYPRRKDLGPFAVLARLSNDDKHRNVIPVRMSHTSFDRHHVIVIGGEPVRFQRRLRPGQPVQNGTELFRVWTDPPKAQVEMKGHITTTVSLETGGPLFPTLTAMATLVNAVMRDFLPLWAEHIGRGLTPPPMNLIPPG